MTYEEKLIVDQFQEHFGNLKDKHIILYGIGIKTKLIIEHFKEHKIIGIWNKEGIGNTISGKEIISYEKGLELGVELVIIVASQFNNSIIFNRIEQFCSEHDILVYSMDGKLQKSISYSEKSYDKYTKISCELLLKKIEAADIVSFDIFDTIITRRILYPEDIFDIVERKSGITGFSIARKEAEQQLCNEALTPNIFEIYRRLKHNLSLSNQISEFLMGIEIETEKEYLICRNSMVKMLKYAQDIGKKVILTSDMYLTKEIIGDILLNMGINMPIGDIFVSCDLKCSKRDGAFNILLERFQVKRILHIGDNIDVDFDCALNAGINDAFHIKSGLAMLVDSYASFILKYDDTLDNRIVIGEFIAKELNDPFLFNETKGRFKLIDDKEVGYSFIAPYIYKWINWATQKIAESKFDRILFGARDGYLLFEICKLLNLDFIKRSVYFYASRLAALMAMLQSDEDILYFSKMAYVGSITDMLIGRFGLAETEILKRNENESDDDYILRHRESILSKAEKKKHGYMKYINKLNIGKDEKIAFIDFIAAGTCQTAIERITGWSLRGLYFCHVFRPGIVVDSLYSTKSLFSDYEFRSIQLTQVLETMLSSAEPSLKGADENGGLIFGEEIRTEETLKSLRLLQEGILDYASLYGKIDFSNVDLNLTDAIAGLICKEYSIRNNEYFKLVFMDDQLSNTKYDFDF